MAVFEPALGQVLLHKHKVSELATILDTRYIKKGGDTTTGSYTFTGDNSSNNTINIITTLTDPAISRAGLQIVTTFTPTADTSQRTWGLLFSNVFLGSHVTSDYFGQTGLEGNTKYTSSVNSSGGITGGLFYGALAGTGNIDHIFGLLAYGNDISGGGVVTESHSLRINDDFVHGGSSVTTKYGLFINNITSGGTNYAIYTGNGHCVFNDFVQFGGNASVPYGNAYQVGYGENWSSGTHNLIYTHFTSADQVDYYTPGNSRSTPILSMLSNATMLTNIDVIFGAAVTPSGNGALQIKVGSSSSPAKVGGVIFDHFADAGNTTTGETDLYSDTTVANTLAANGDKITAEYGGIFVASGTATRDIRAYFAGISLFDSTGLTTATAEAWSLKITIIRESSSVIRSIVTFIATTAVGASVNTDVQYTRVTGLTLTGTNILKITGQAGGVGAATNDIVAKLGTILFMPGL